MGGISNGKADSRTKRWLKEHDIILEEGFVEAVLALGEKHNLKKGEVYRQIGCNKTDICRWQANPCITHAKVKSAKLSVVQKAADIFQLSQIEAEKLANKAGISLHTSDHTLKDILTCKDHKTCKIFVSERMLEYYAQEKRLPTKQVLLAIGITSELSLKEIKQLLQAYGFSLSSSLPNDVVVKWFLDNNVPSQTLLYQINEVLEELSLPLLMTKQRL